MVELLVYSVLSVVILTISGGMLIMSINTRVQITDISQMTSTGQLIAVSVQEGVRNASGTGGATADTGIKTEDSAADGSQLMRARVAVGAENGLIAWRCQAWFYSAETEAVYMAISDAGAIEDPVTFSVSNDVHTAAAGTANWTLLGDGVRRVPPNAFFSTGSSEKKVTLRFEMQRKDVSLVLIPSTIVKRSIVAGGTGPTACY